jgi:hypothetical protein
MVSMKKYDIFDAPCSVLCGARSPFDPNAIKSIKSYKITK